MTRATDGSSDNGHAGDHPPGGETPVSWLGVAVSGEAMAMRLEVVGARTVGGEESLGVSGCFGAARPPFPLARGLVRILGPIV